MHCIVFCCIVFQCILLHSIVLCYMPLYYIPLFCFTLCRIVFHCIILYSIVSNCILSYCIVFHSIILYSFVLYCIVFHCTLVIVHLFYCNLFYCIVFYYIVLPEHVLKKFITALFNRKISFHPSFTEIRKRFSISSLKILMTFLGIEYRIFGSIFSNFHNKPLISSLISPFHPTKFLITFFVCFFFFSTLILYSTLQKHPFIIAHFLHHSTLKHALPIRSHEDGSF